MVIVAGVRTVLEGFDIVFDISRVREKSNVCKGSGGACRCFLVYIVRVRSLKQGCAEESQAAI